MKKIYQDLMAGKQQLFAHEDNEKHIQQVISLDEHLILQSNIELNKEKYIQLYEILIKAV